MISGSAMAAFLYQEVLKIDKNDAESMAIRFKYDTKAAHKSIKSYLSLEPKTLEPKPYEFINIMTICRNFALCNYSDQLKKSILEALAIKFVDDTHINSFIRTTLCTGIMEKVDTYDEQSDNEPNKFSRKDMVEKIAKTPTITGRTLRIWAYAHCV